MRAFLLWCWDERKRVRLCKCKLVQWWRACRYHRRSFVNVTDAPEKGYGEYFDNEQRPQNSWLYKAPPRISVYIVYVYIQNWKYCFVYWACITESITITYYRRKSFQQSSPRQRYKYTCTFLPMCWTLFRLFIYYDGILMRVNSTLRCHDVFYQCSCVRIMLLRTKIHHNLNVSRSLLRCTHNSKQ